MTTLELQNKLQLRALTSVEPNREIAGAYAGDLLSWVMGRAEQDMVWVTIMTNINVVAVASLIDFSAVIFAENCTPEENVIKAAEAKGVTLFVSPKATYEICAALHHLSI